MSKKHKHGGGKLQFRELDFSFTEKQKDILKYLEHPDTKVVFLTGPAGTSKSFISVYAALKLLDRNYNKDILYIRSVVESASRSMGYLPGLASEKLEPYLMPLFDKCEEILHPECAKKLLDEQKIEATPVNFLRGASWKNRIVVADELQNYTVKEIVTIMTRLGEGSVLFMCGDPSQADIHNSGFQKVIDAFHTEESDELGIYGFSFEKEDIVRSQILKYIVERLETIK